MLWETTFFPQIPFNQRRFWITTTVKCNLQLVDNFLQVVGLNFTGHNLHHLLADLADLLVLGIGCFSDLVVAPLCEANAEQTQKVAIGGLHIDVGFDHGLNTNKSWVSVYSTYKEIIWVFKFPISVWTERFFSWCSTWNIMRKTKHINPDFEAKLQLPSWNLPNPSAIRIWSLVFFQLYIMYNNYIGTWITTWKLWGWENTTTRDCKPARNQIINSREDEP